MRRAAVIVSLALASAVARADDTHYQDYVIGGRGVVLGGAYTSLADDASGLYYNPAGIADARFTSLSLSASLYGFERGEIDEPLGFLGVPGVENLAVEFTDLIVIPASAGFVKTFGEPGNDGLPRQAYGLSVVVPSFRSSALSTTDDDQAGFKSYKRRVTDRELWSGIGYGRKIGRRLRLGISAFYILRSVADLEDVTVQESTADGDKFDSVVNDITLLNGSILFIAGGKYVLTDSLTVGAAIQSPSIQLHSQAALRFTRLGSDPSQPGGGVSSFDRLNLPNADSETKWAPVLRVGAHYKRKYKYTISVDASFHAPISYTLVQVGDEYVEYKERLPFNPDIERRFVANVNVGAEYLIIREVSVAVGMFSDFSSAPPIGPNPTRDQPPRVHLLGLTMALGYFGKHSLSRLGFVYSFGSGKDVIPTSNIGRALEQQQEFERVDYAQSFFYVFVSSTFRY